MFTLKESMFNIWFKYNLFSCLTLQNFNTYLTQQCSYVEFTYFVTGSHFCQQQATLKNKLIGKINCIIWSHLEKICLPYNLNTIFLSHEPQVSQNRIYTWANNISHTSVWLKWGAIGNMLGNTLRTWAHIENLMGT